MKKALKVIIIFTIIFASTHFNVSAKIPENCKIKSSPSKELTTYLKNIRKIVSNINKEIISQNTNSYNKGKSEALRLYNTLTSWNDYFTEFDFKVREPIFNNIPKPLRRDEQLLQREIEKLNNLLSIYAKRGVLDLNIDTSKVCEGIENCNLNNKLGKAIAQIIDSTKNMKLLLEKAATNNKKISNNCNNVIGISHQECENFFKVYLDSKQNCVDDGKKESIFKIGLNFKNTEDGIQKWKEAWALLIGNVSIEKYQKIERDLLKKELARQGLSTSQTKQILQNLDEYNNTGFFSLTNNPVSNIVKTITNAIDKDQLRELKQFHQTLADLFKGDKKEMPISKIVKKLEEKKKENISNYDINTLYNQMLPLAQMEDLDTNQLVREITLMNIKISQSNNILEKTIPLSEKTCNSQDQGNGKCQY